MKSALIIPSFFKGWSYPDLVDTEKVQNYTRQQEADMELGKGRVRATVNHYRQEEIRF
jgi:hypothetical protein